MNKKEQAKKLFKSVYDENPSQFKEDFKEMLKQRTIELINKKRKDIQEEMNEGFGIISESEDKDEPCEECGEIECECEDSEED